MKKATLPDNSIVPQYRNTDISDRLKPAGAVILGGDFQALGVLRSLARHNVPVYLLDKGPCIGKFSRYVSKFARCPDAREENLLLQFLIDLARKDDLEGWLLFPNDDDTVRFLARNKERLEEYYRVTTPPWEIARFACEKKLTYELAEKYGIAVPRTLYPRDIAELEQLDMEFPVIIKPSVKEPFYSRTRKKAIRTDSKEELINEFIRVRDVVGDSEIMVQEFIPGGVENLYSVGSLFKNGELLAKIAARRLRQHPMDFGHATTYAETVDIPEMEDTATRILKAMGYYGLAEIEFMWDPKDRQYKLIEINPRPWGWHTLAIGAGVNLPYLLYRDMLGEDVSQNGITPGQAKWMRLLTDVPTVLPALLKGKIGLRDYARSLTGKKQFAVFSFKDPLPFIAELFMLPYLWKKRGF
jgi:predicted ATP-grasp superfamily ATP-dependent carboligase